MGKYFGTDGFRGEANVVLTVEHAFKVGRFLGWYYGQEHKARVVIGKDTRRSSYMFEDALSAGLTASGADVYLLHVTTTPSVSYVTRTEDFDCGIMISASHNIFYDNGIKVINAKGHKLEAEIEEKISDVSAETSQAASEKKQVLIKEGMRLNQAPVSKEEVIQAAGELLHQLGYVDETYVDAMQEREKLITTYMGMGVAIPHGTSQAKGTVKKTGIVFLQYPEGVDFGDEKAQLVFGIAGIGDEHLDLLAKICEVLEDDEVLEKMKTTSDLDWVMERLS